MPILANTFLRVVESADAAGYGQVRRGPGRRAKATEISDAQMFIASVAHELKQPLSGILTNASTCLRSLDANVPERARRAARLMLRDVERCALLVESLRAHFANQEAQLKLVSLNETVRQVLTTSSCELARNRVVVHCSLANALPPLATDRVQLQQVILNLVRNAIEAMKSVHDRSRELSIATSWNARSRQALVSVRDTGPGISPLDSIKLFKPFHTTKPDGTGVGLFLSRSIAERHGGRLWASSNSGPGMTFWLSMPASSRPLGG